MRKSEDQLQKLSYSDEFSGHLLGFHGIVKLILEKLTWAKIKNQLYWVGDVKAALAWRRDEIIASQCRYEILVVGPVSNRKI